MPKKTVEELRAARLVAARKRVRAVEMRTIGAAYQTIADTLGVAKSTAHRYIRKALEEIAKEERIPAEILRALEFRKIDALMSSAWKALHPRVVNPKNPKGPKLIDDTKIDPHVAAIILRCIQVRSRLLGLYQQGEVGEGHAGGIEQLLMEIDKAIVIVPAAPSQIPAGGNGRGNGEEPRTIDVEPSP